MGRLGNAFQRTSLDSERGETGGADLGGQEGKHLVEWIAPADAEEKDFQIWAVVRDGRGGISWLNRLGHYTP